MTGRPVDVPAIGERGPRRRRLAAAAAALALVGLGVAIGSRIATPAQHDDRDRDRGVAERNIYDTSRTGCGANAPECGNRGGHLRQ